MTLTADTEGSLVQQATADYLEQQFEWKSNYAFNNEVFVQDRDCWAVAQQGGCMSNIVIFESEAQQAEGWRQVRRQRKHDNLDAIILECRHANIFETSFVSQGLLC